jgi:hypothetical protein
MDRLNLDDLKVETLAFGPSDDAGGLESLRMGHGFTEVGASCCCSSSPCSCCVGAAPLEDEL